MIAAVILIVTVTVLGFMLASYLLKVRLRRQHLKTGATFLKPETPYDPENDPFYCIHLKDGSSRHGKIVNFDEGPDDGFTCVMLSDGTTIPGFSKKDDNGAP